MRCAKAKSPRRHKRPDPGKNRKHEAWIRSLTCSVLVCGGCFGPVAPHHIRTAANSGTGMKPDSAWCVPLCVAHHDEYHRGKQTFERKYGIDLGLYAEKLWFERQLAHLTNR